MLYTIPMTLRQTKQLIYGAFYLIVWLGILIGIYFWLVRPVPSCFDGTQNQGEVGVDCGGPCVLACIPSNLHKISVLGNVLTFASSPGHYTVLAQIANTNSGFAAESFDFRFNLYDASGTVVASAPGRSFMYAGEVKYLMVPNLSVTSEVEQASLAISNVHWVEAAALGVVPQFVVQNLGAGPASSGTVATQGEIVNRDIAAFEDVLVVGIFKSSSGGPVGASQTLIDHLSPNETRSFSVFYPAVPGVDPARTELYAYAFRL
jgi:hypothetical protein